MRPGAEQMARRKIDVRTGSPAVQRGLRASDNTHRNRAAVIHRLPQHRHGVGHCWIVVTGAAHEHPWTTTVRDRTATQTEDKHERSSREGSSSLLGSGGNALLNLSRTQIYELIRTSRLVTVTQGRRRLVPADSITDYVQLLLAERGGSRHGARDWGLL